LFTFQLEKVLQQGDISECADPYIKEEKVSFYLFDINYTNYTITWCL